MQAGKFIQASDIKTAGQYPVYGGNGLRGYAEVSNCSGKYPIVGRQGEQCGNVKLVSGDFYATEHAVVTTPKDDVNVDFLYYLLDKLNLHQYAVGQAQPGLSVNTILKVNCVLPTLPEQQKIASCLSSLDEYISLTKKKLDLLKLHKKGLLQNLFPKNGETKPKFRFPGFEGEWKVVKLGEIGDVCMCKRIMKNETNTLTGIPFYKIGTFGQNADAYISEDLFLAYKSKYPYPKKGEVLISAAGTIGRTMIFDGSPSYYQDSNIVWLSNDESKVYNYFLFYIYSFIEWAVDDGGVVKRLYNDSIRKTIILFPSLAEQGQIASCLSSIDNKIAKYGEKLKAMEVHKKGLMQKLFPKIN